jgi:hypothetical protein
LDKFPHTTIYVDDTNIIVASTNSNDLHTTVNATVQFISEWFQINQFVLNKNKTFAINFSWAKTPSHTLNIILDNQNFLLKNQLILLMTLVSYLHTLI